jgi:hypothetical protein
LSLRFGPGRFGLALPPATDYKQINNILSLQMVGRWPTFLLPKGLGPEGGNG